MLRLSMANQVLIYIARCLSNGKRYIGITSGPLKTRIRRHLNVAKRGSPYAFHRALMKYSVEGFVWEAVDCVPTWEAACLREIALIKEYDARNPLLGYNLTGGGDGALGLSPPQKSRAKISSSLKAWHASGDPKAAALRDKVSQTRKTFPTSLETRLKKAADGRRRRGTFSPESCAKLSASKRLYSDAVVTEVTAFALEHGFRAAERKFGIPRPTIRRWTHSPEKKAEENRKMRERAYTKQYGYAFRTIPLVTQDM